MAEGIRRVNESLRGIDSKATPTVRERNGCVEVKLGVVVSLSNSAVAGVIGTAGAVGNTQITRYGRASRLLQL
jgi:hypothetical protein